MARGARDPKRKKERRKGEKAEEGKRMSTERRRGDDADFARACAREREREREKEIENARRDKFQPFK